MLEKLKCSKITLLSMFENSNELKTFVVDTQFWPCVQLEIVIWVGGLLFQIQSKVVGGGK